MANQVRQNFHEDCEAAINKQINMELYASYVYLSMVNMRRICNLFSKNYAIFMLIRLTILIAMMLHCQECIGISSTHLMKNENML
jgi:ferritin heavy chain